MVSTHTVEAPGLRLGHIVADHHALRHEANDLLVLAEHGRELDHALRNALVERLGRLCERLRVHFALEEDGGYLREVLARRPGLGVHVARLEHEHEVMLAEGTALARQLLSAPPPRDVRVRIVCLLETLREHELAEHDLIQEALVVDLGGGD
jgi:hypothetical protein